MIGAIFSGTTYDEVLEEIFSGNVPEINDTALQY